MRYPSKPIPVSVPRPVSGTNGDKIMSPQHPDHCNREPSRTRTPLGMMVVFLAAHLSVMCSMGCDQFYGTYDIDADGIPRFVDVDYIELSKIDHVSKFRSGQGHDYSDAFESCRSMKHYFYPKDSVDASAVKVFAPVDGTVSWLFQESAGTQIQIRSTEYPAFVFVIFHVNDGGSLGFGDTVVAGQQLGTHIGSMTGSDIAVRVNTPAGGKLVSYFDVMTDAVFAAYQARGVSTRDELILSQESRDAAPMTCAGEEFTSTDSLDSGVSLN